MKIVLIDGSVLWSDMSVKDFVKVAAGGRWIVRNGRAINLANIAYLEETEAADPERGEE